MILTSPHIKSLISGVVQQNSESSRWAPWRSWPAGSAPSRSSSVTPRGRSSRSRGSIRTTALLIMEEWNPRAGPSHCQIFFKDLRQKLKTILTNGGARLKREEAGCALVSGQKNPPPRCLLIRWRRHSRRRTLCWRTASWWNITGAQGTSLPPTSHAGTWW